MGELYIMYKRPGHGQPQIEHHLPTIAANWGGAVAVNNGGLSAKLQTLESTVEKLARLPQVIRTLVTDYDEYRKQTDKKITNLEERIAALSYVYVDPAQPVDPSQPVESQQADPPQADLPMQAESSQPTEPQNTSNVSSPVMIPMDGSLMESLQQLINEANDVVNLVTTAPDMSDTLPELPPPDVKEPESKPEVQEVKELELKESEEPALERSQSVFISPFSRSLETLHDDAQTQAALSAKSTKSTKSVKTVKSARKNGKKPKKPKKRDSDSD